MTLFPRCPDGHRWWACSHEELARPVIGSIMMAVGAFTILAGLAELLRIV